jgi:enamine deaminase RidA (YjgF/YER057c/UK114 family)
MGGAMMHKLVNPPGLAEPAGFSHAVVPARGQTVYLAGQTALSPEGRIEGRTIAQQFDRAASNLLAALATAGGQPQDVVSLQVFVTDVEEYKADLAEVGQVYRSHFGRHYPAMALLGVSRLWDAEAKIELMGVAVVPEPGK